MHTKYINLSHKIIIFRKWEKQLEDATKKRKRPRLLKALIATFWPEYLILGLILAILEIALGLIRPKVLGYFLDYFKPGSVTTENSALW